MMKKDNTNQNSPKVTLKGKIVHYLYDNSSNSFKVARFKTHDGIDYKLIGRFQSGLKNTQVIVTGTCEYNTKYNETQINVEIIEVDTKITSVSGVVKYLSGKNFKGIGKKTAEIIVENLGIDCIKTIAENPDVLQLVPIAQSMKLVVVSQIKNVTERSRQTLALMKYGLTELMANRVYDKYQSNSLTKVEQNPYDLMFDFERLGLAKCDELAKNMGIALSDPRRITAVVLHILLDKAGDGDSFVPKDQLQKLFEKTTKDKIDFEGALKTLIEKKKIVIDGEDIYLKSYYWAEKQTADRLLLIGHYPLNVKLENVEDAFKKHCQDAIINYSDEQQQAIKTALQNKLTIITGGPGTGKTTIVNGIVQTAKTAFDDELNIILLAPTGRAAKRMTESIGMQASTIHKALGYDFHSGYFSHNESNPLACDIVILDETSMVDISLMSSLLKAIPDYASFIIVGDVDQLPSVGPGLVLSDMINSNCFKTIKLHTIYRQQAGSEIIELANAVNHDKVTPKLLRDFNQDIMINHFDSDELLVKNVEKLVKELLINKQLGIQEFQILCPQYRGTAGVNNFNNLVQQLYIKPNSQSLTCMIKGFKEGDSFNLYIGDKVLQTENNYEKEIMNGDIGIVLDIIKIDGELSVKIKFDERVITYDLTSLQQIKLAYAITVHKSQGSESKIIIYPFSASHFLLTKKELIYTAITRAKEKLYLMGNLNKFIEYYPNRENLRYSKLIERLKTNRFMQQSLV